MALLPIERDRWIELLRSDIPTFNAELRDLPLFSRPDLRGADLRVLDLSEAIVAQCDLTDADMSGCTTPQRGLPSCRLVGTNLTGATWTSTDDQEAVRQIQLMVESPDAFNDYRQAVEPVPLLSADLSGQVLGALDLRGIDLLLANLEGADLSLCLLWSVELVSARLKGAKFAGAQLDRARLDKADLSDADLRGSRLTVEKRRTRCDM